MVADTRKLQLKGYEVYRSTSKSGKYTKIKTTANIIVADTGVTIGKTYYYKVRAYFKDAKGNKIYGSFSNTISRKVVSSLKNDEFIKEMI